MIRVASRRGGWAVIKLAELVQNPSSSKALLSAATSSRVRDSVVEGTFPRSVRFLSRGTFKGDDFSSRFEGSTVTNWGIRVVPEKKAFVIERFGKHLKTLSSGIHLGQLGSSDSGELLKRSITSTRTLSSGSKEFSVSTTLSGVGCRSLLSADRQEVGSLVTIARQFSSPALAVEEDETFRRAAEIGYEVLGQYVPEGPRIKPQAAFAVVQVGSHQFKVTPGDMIYTEKLKYADINDKLLLNKVLLVGSLEQTIIGRPTIPQAGVLAAVEEMALDAKVIVFKKKRRKNYRRTNGHRQELTRLRILQIEGIETPTSTSNDQVQEQGNPV